MLYRYLLLAGSFWFFTAFSAQAQVTYTSPNNLPNGQAAHQFQTGPGNTSVLKIRQDGRVGICVGNYGDWQIKSRFNVGLGMGSFTADNLLSTGTAAATCIGFNAAWQDDGSFYLGTSAGPVRQNGGAIVWSDIQGGLNFSTVPSNGNPTADQWVTASNATSIYRRLRINPDGKVFIGEGTVSTNSPHYGTYKLAVQGKLLAQSVYVTQQSWADFVFEPDYALMPLPELERYLHRYKHLPTMPSAVEVAANGVDVGDVAARLLQQVEELTLHVIALGKQNAQLQADLAALAARTGTAGTPAPAATASPAAK